MDKELISSIIGSIGGLCGGVGIIMIAFYLFDMAQQKAIHQAFSSFEDDVEGEDELV